MRAGERAGLGGELLGKNPGVGCWVLGILRRPPTPDTRHLAVSLLFACLSLAPAVAGSQLRPDDHWLTIRTPHFSVHFTAPVEETARRAAANAERAYAQLAAELTPPRGPIDLVVSDNVDFTNGYATPVPTNRIVVYAQPPVSELTLRLYDDWNALVITHELTHIFHLDRTRGWWRAAQHVFGRNPLLFPNAYAPSWITEGLAVYYETRLTGYGRLAGSQHRMYARASILGGDLPRLDELSLGTPRFPQGQVAYAYGSLLVDYLARTRGPERVREFVERTSGQPLPFFYNTAARRAFGITLRGARLEWRDSLRREEGARSADEPTALAGWRELTGGGWYALHPRWVDSASVVYAGYAGREMPGAYRVPAAGGRSRRLGRRNGTEPNVPLPDGALLYAQLDYTSPYDVRSDLYVSRGGADRRLTRGARLSAPDARRADGAIVAVQAAPGTTRLVRVSPDGRTIAALTTTSADTQWAEPRWSPDGARLAATRLLSTGVADVVVLDTTGRVLQVVAQRRSVESSPVWSADGSRLLFTSDRSGTTEIYEARPTDSASAAAAPVRRLSASPAGVFYPAPSPRGDGVAAALFRADGYRIAVAAYDTAAAAADTVGDAPPGPRAARATVPGADAIAAAPARRYSPWRGLLPRYWLPVVASTDEDEIAVGAFTSGEDVVGRHSYAAELTLAPRKADEVDASLAYRYAGLGLPLLDLSVAQSWDHGTVTDASDVAVGTLRRNARTASLAATVVRPRMRTYAAASLGAGIERREYSTDPASLLPRLDDFFSSRPLFPSVFASASWTNTQRPALSISPEDGLSVAGSVRERWLRGGAGDDRERTAAAVFRGFRSLDLPGFAHHVLAVRAAGFWGSAGADAQGAGGVSGTSLEIFPGLAIGDGGRLLGVRGFPTDAVRGLRAYGGSFEYRAPLTMPARGIASLPIFLSRTSLSAFADAATAWCPARLAERAFDCRPLDFERVTIASAGAELNLDAALQYDVPYRLRAGLATPIARRDRFGQSRVAGYVTAGLSF